MMIQTVRKSVRVALPHGSVASTTIYAPDNRAFVLKAAAFIRETAKRLGVSTLALEWSVV